MQKTNSLNSRIDKAIFEYKLLEGVRLPLGHCSGLDYESPVRASEDIAGKYSGTC